MVDLTKYYSLTEANLGSQSGQQTCPHEGIPCQFLPCLSLKGTGML